MRSSVRILAVAAFVAINIPAVAQQRLAQHEEAQSLSPRLSDPLTVPIVRSGIIDPDHVQARDAVCSPNPFTGAAILRCKVEHATTVTITVVDESGREVARLVDDLPINVGEHAFPFDGATLPAGRYYCRIRGNGVDRIVKMMLVR